MFEKIERLLKRELEQILKIPVIVGFPETEWIKKSGYPSGAVMLDTVKILDWIEDGLPEATEDHEDHVIEDYALASAEMNFAFHLFCDKKVILEQLTLKLLYEFSKKSVITDDNVGQDFSLANGIQFRDTFPEEERVFERVFLIPLTGNIIEKVKAYKGTIEFIFDISTSEDVLK